MELMEFSTLLANTGTDFSLAGMWEQMGIIAKFVMVLLMLMFLLSLALMIERSRAYSRAKRQSISYIMLLRNFLQERKLQEAVTAAGQHGDSPLAKVVGAGMSEYLKGMEALQEEGPEDVGDFDLVDAVNRQLERAKERETANLKRGLTVLATVGSTSVFVGLFGTVVGTVRPRLRLAVSRSLARSSWRLTASTRSKSPTSSGPSSCSASIPLRYSPMPAPTTLASGLSAC